VLIKPSINLRLLASNVSVKTKKIKSLPPELQKPEKERASNLEPRIPDPRSDIPDPGVWLCPKGSPEYALMTPSPTEWMTLSGLSGSVRLLITVFGVGVVEVFLPGKHQSVEAWELLTHRMSKARAPALRSEIFLGYIIFPTSGFSIHFLFLLILTAALTDKLGDFIITIFCCHISPFICLTLFFLLWAKSRCFGR